MPTYSSDWDPGDARANNEYRDRMGFGGTEFGGQQYAQRSRMLGDQAQGRGAYQSDFTQSNQTRGQQMDALDLLHGAAAGTAPSQAAIQAQAAGDRSAAAGMSLAGGVKGGPGARVAATRAALAGNAAQGQQIAREAAAGRANEMAQARSGYAQAGAATRAGDLDATRIQQTNELTQRQANDAQQRFFEQQGFNTQVQDQNNQLQQQGMANNAWVNGRQAEMANEQFGFGKDMTFVNAGAGAVQGGVSAALGASGGGGSTGSDERMKYVVSPRNLTLSPAEAKVPASFDGLEDAGRTAATALTPWKGADAARLPMSGAAPASFDKLNGGGMDVIGSLKAHSDFATRFQRDPSGGMMNGGMMLSPVEAKVPASLDDAMRAPSPTYGHLDEPTRDYGAPPADPNADAMASYERSFGVQSAVDDARNADNRKEAQKIRAGFGQGESDRRANVLASIFGGAQRGIMVSDDKAKLKAAFEQGVKYSDASNAAAAGQPVAPHHLAVPGYVSGKSDAQVRERADKAHAAAQQHKLEAMSPEELAKYTDEKAAEQNQRMDDARRFRGTLTGKTEPASFKRDTKADQNDVAFDYLIGPEQGPGYRPSQPAPPPAAPPPDATPSLMARVGDFFRSDEKTKRAGDVPERAMYAAMKSMEPSLYAYKPEFKPPEQRPGEVQAGPMANNMERNPVAALTLVKDPGTGLLAIDKDKALKLTMGSLAVLADDVEDLKRKKGSR